jgi:hypothetical protein
MQVRGDIESVNLNTGERFQRVCGNGESRLASLGRPLNPEEKLALERFEHEMRDVVIPNVVQTMRRRAEAAQRNRFQILY